MNMSLGKMSTFVIVLAGLCASCTQQPKTPDVSETLSLDTSISSMKDAALISSGPLHGDVADGKACFWFGEDGGNTQSLVWPEGYTAIDNPLRVLDSSGAVAATVGDTGLRIGGNPSEADGCHPGSTSWIVHVDGLTSS